MSYGSPGEYLGLAQKDAGQFAIVVADVDAVGAELEEHGVKLISGPADRDWGMRTLTFADPGGCTWGSRKISPGARPLGSRLLAWTGKRSRPGG